VQDLEIAIIQDELDWHDPAANRRRFDEHLRHLPPADLIVLPEMFTTGFTMAAADHAEPMDGLTVAWMQEHARSREAVICGSLIVRETRFGEARGWRIAPMVCYDLRFPVWSRHCHDCDALIYVANWPASRHFAWETLLRARAIENQCYVIGVNRAGRDGNGLDYRGGSAAVDFLGATLTGCGEPPCVTTTVLSLEALRTFRRNYPFHLDADTFRLSD